MKLISIFMLASIFLFQLCKPKTETTKNTSMENNSYWIDSTDNSFTTPLLSSYSNEIQQSLLQSQGLLLRNDSLTTNEKLAQNIALKDKRFNQYLKDSISNKAYRNQVLGIYPTRESDLAPEHRIQCANNNCYKVELYNFALNLTTVVIVNLQKQETLLSYQLPNTQPDITPKLKQMVLQMATQHPKVIEALGYSPKESEALMTDTKTALNRTRCERSKHLCVAPTFVKGDKALWVIVDITDLRIVGLRWTQVGNAGPIKPITERKIQNENITECCCKSLIPLEKNKWKLNYMLTSSDGLRISEVKYDNKSILQSAKLVDWHVSYANTDGFGYSDAVGCPYFSTAAVLAVEPPRISDLIENNQVNGFVLEQNFYSEGWPQPCNYNYQQRYEFYNDGRFRVAAASLGRGCGNNGTYRPVFRIVFEGNSKVAMYKGNSMQEWTREQWVQQSEITEYNNQGAWFNISNGAGLHYNMLPGNGQFGDKGRGDKAWFYASKINVNTDEGESDMVTIGPCCNTDYQQGPEKFIEENPEYLTDSPIALWYVAELKNDDTQGNEYCWASSYLNNGVYGTKAYPCYAGPMFVPTSNP